MNWNLISRLVTLFDALLHIVLNMLPDQPENNE